MCEYELYTSDFQNFDSYHPTDIQTNTDATKIIHHAASRVVNETMTQEGHFGQRSLPTAGQPAVGI